jgi:hypothetical protein
MVKEAEENQALIVRLADRLLVHIPIILLLYFAVTDDWRSAEDGGCLHHQPPLRIDAGDTYGGRGKHWEQLRRIPSGTRESAEARLSEHRGA